MRLVLAIIAVALSAACGGESMSGELEALDAAAGAGGDDDEPAAVIFAPSFGDNRAP